MRSLITIQQRSENGYGFYSPGLNWVWKMEYFSLKLGQVLGNRAAHPYQKFRGVPPGHLTNSSEEKPDLYVDQDQQYFLMKRKTKDIPKYKADRTAQRVILMPNISVRHY